MPTARPMKTARAGDPLQDLRELAEAPTLEWAKELGAQVRPKVVALHLLARRRDITAEVTDIARRAEANPALAVKEARRLRGWLYHVLASLMTAEPPAAKATARPKATRRRPGRPPSRKPATPRKRTAGGIDPAADGLVRAIFGKS